MARRKSDAAIKLSIQVAFSEPKDLAFLGLSISRIWTYAFLLTLGVRFHSVMLTPSLQVNLGNILFFGIGALAAFAVALFSSKLERVFEKASIVGIVVTGILGALFLVLYEFTPFSFFIYLAALFGGLTLAFLRLAWGNQYGRVEPQKSGFYTALSLIVAIVIVVLLKCCPNEIAAVSLFILPCIGAACLMIASQRVQAETKIVGEASVKGAAPPFWPLALTMFIFVGANALLKTLLDDTIIPEWPLDWYTIIVDMLVAVVFLGVYLISRKFNPLLVYRIILPLMVVGYVIFPLVPGRYQILGIMLTAIGYGLFDLLSWVIMAKFVYDNKADPLRIFGIGVGATMLGRSVGYAIGDLLFGYQALGHLPLSTISLVMVCVLVVVVVLVLPEGFIFRITNPVGLKGVTEDTLAACEALSQAYGLTPREFDVFVLLARGRTASAISRELHIAQGTAQTHIKHIYSKMQLHSQQELIDLIDQTDITAL